MPSSLKRLTVERQSAPVEKFEIMLEPFAIEDNITALCDIDLSAGIVISPLSFFILLTIFSIVLIVAYY